MPETASLPYNRLPTADVRRSNSAGNFHDPTSEAVPGIGIDLRGRDRRRGQAGPTVFINEIHYDNTGTDAGEFIEIAGTGRHRSRRVSIVLYNGAAARPTTPTSLSGTIPNQQNGFGTVSLAYPVERHPERSARWHGAGPATRRRPVPELRRARSRPGRPRPTGMTEHRHRRDRGRHRRRCGQSLRLTGTGTGYSDFAWARPARQHARRGQHRPDLYRARRVPRSRSTT